MGIKQVLESTKKLNSNERAMLAHCLISSLDSVQDTGVEDAWVALAEKRLKQLDSGEVKAVSWDEIKKNLREK